MASMRVGRHTSTRTVDGGASCAALALVASLGAAGLSDAQTSRTAEFTPSGSAYTYFISTDTFVTRPSLTIENVGAATVSGIRLIANGRDLTSIDAILDTILDEGMTDEQRARAIWQFARTNAYAWFTYSELDPESSDPVRFFNSYGYGLCSDSAAASAALYARAGFPVRTWGVGFPSGHVVPEVYFDGAWHVMDANRNILFLARDNRTIAGMEALIADPWLIDRAGPASADLRPIYVSTPLGAYRDVVAGASTTLRLALRPGERFDYLAEPMGVYRHDTTIPTGAPPSYANAVHSSRHVAGVHGTDEVFDSGHGLGTHGTGASAHWTPAEANAPARFSVTTPHPLVSSTLRVTGRMADPDDRIRVYAARAGRVTLTAGDLASGAAFDNPAVVSHQGLEAVGGDESFAGIHVGPAGHGELVLRVERPDVAAPLILAGRFFRSAEADGLAIDVSVDGVTWEVAWGPAFGTVGTIAAKTDASPLVGAAANIYVRYRFAAVSAEGGAAGAAELSITGVAAIPTTLIGTVAAAEGPAEFDLTPLVAPARGPASYGYVLRFAFEGSAGLESFETTNVMQVAPRQLPAPIRGTTSFALAIDTGDAADLRVRHSWTEIDTLAPQAPVQPLLPRRGKALALSGPLTFSWVPSREYPISNLIQYELQVCADETCGSPLSTVTQVATAPPPPSGPPGAGDDEHHMATSPSTTLDAVEWFEPGRAYYWRVRAMSHAGEWSRYSDTWSFVAVAGAGKGLTLVVDGPDGDRRTHAPLIGLSGSVAGGSGPVTVSWTTDRGASGAVTSSALWQLTNVPLVGGSNEITIVASDGQGQSVTRRVRYDVPYYAYYLAEGSTQGGFSTDLAVANPGEQLAPVEVHFMLDGGGTVMQAREIRPLSTFTLSATDVVGSGRAFAIEVRSLDAVPLAVERTMRWGPGLASGHSGAAVMAPSTTWYFAEGSQGYFDTFVLLANPDDAPVPVNLAFLTEAGSTVVHELTIPGRARETVWTRQFPQLTNQSFSIIVTGGAPLVAERAVYFGQPAWTGGHVSAGAPQLAGRWFCPEGATGPYLDTYVLVGNPSSSQAAPVTVEYLTGAGAVVTETFTVAPHSRLTIDVESRAPALANAAVSTVVSSTSPVVVERATYWGGAFTQWLDGHSSMGTVSSGSAWAVADVRVGGAEAFETWLLLTNETTADIQVDLTLLPEEGDATTTRVVVPARSRYNVNMNAELPGLDGHRVGVRLVSVGGAPFAVERSQYWSVNGVAWSGGTSSRATMLR